MTKKVLIALGFVLFIGVLPLDFHLLHGIGMSFYGRLL